MGFIKDPDLFKAVTFAASMIKKGQRKGLSIWKAANYYGVDQSKVASELGKRGASVNNYLHNNKEKAN
tara:strand:- start:939 stop:1142 length:204 start_codon:yes stop_codon:yes gene_type:complete